MFRTVLWAALLASMPIFGQAPEITVELPGGVPLEMVWIEPGTFLMGGEPDLVQINSFHGPQHTVTLTKGFYLGNFEVTQAQWVAVMGTKPWEEYDDIDCPNCSVTWSRLPRTA